MNSCYQASSRELTFVFFVSCLGMALDCPQFDVCESTRAAEQVGGWFSVNGNGGIIKSFTENGLLVSPLK